METQEQATVKTCLMCERPVTHKHGNYCYACRGKIARSRFVGDKGCRVCGSKVSRSGKMCRKCYLVMWRKIKWRMDNEGRYRKEVDGIPVLYSPSPEV